jgi:hypothetical protein
MHAQGLNIMAEKSIRKPAMSFVLRLWPNEVPGAEIRGEIENIRSGEKRFFRDNRGLVHLLETWANDRQPAG